MQKSENIYSYTQCDVVWSTCVLKLVMIFECLLFLLLVQVIIIVTIFISDTCGAHIVCYARYFTFCSFKPPNNPNKVR